MKKNKIFQGLWSASHRQRSSDTSSEILLCLGSPNNFRTLNELNQAGWQRWWKRCYKHLFTD